jgi:hypothetical protein
MRSLIPDRLCGSNRKMIGSSLAWIDGSTSSNHSGEPPTLPSTLTGFSPLPRLCTAIAK